MRISEIFYSIQGEGKLMGIPSVFIRASGCNLRCVWCDTPYASWEPLGEEMAVEQIVDRIKQWSASHVVVTGGEPMIMPDIAALCDTLHRQNIHITIETAGTVYLPVAVDLASLSPKLSNSTPYEREGGRFATAHERQRMNIAVLQKFIDDSPDFQLKFVVSGESDLVEIHAVLNQLNGWKGDDVLLMPEGVERAVLEGRSGWLGEICKREGFRFCPRLHILMYGNKRGT